MLTTMLVEDQASFRQAVRNDLLSQFPSIKVFEASNGEEAFKGLASSPIDLILMDISLPGKSGVMLAKEIKADKPNTAVVMLTGNDADIFRTAALQAGANGFISKGSVDLAAQVSTVVGCFHEAKVAGRSKPGCLLL